MLFKVAYLSVQRCIYFTPSELVFALKDGAVWNYVDEINEFEKLGRDAFIEMIMASLFEVETSFEGLSIFVLKTVIKSEKLYFQHIALFLRTFLARINMRSPPSHVDTLLMLVDNEADCHDVDSSHHYEDCSNNNSPDKSTSHTDTSSLTFKDAYDHHPELPDDKNADGAFSRKILIYLPAELRRLGGRSQEKDRHDAPYTRFLAYLRKAGMDILFPRKNHDALLSFVYAMFRAQLSMKTLLIDQDEAEKRRNRSKNVVIPYEVGSTIENEVETDDLKIPNVRQDCVHALTHKEMIDTVVHYQKIEARYENVTKTKTRGVIALLKHAASIDSFTPIGDSVQIALNYSVNTFQDLRALHDRYLEAVAHDCNIKLTSEEWKTLIWGEEDADECLLSCLNQIEEISKYLSTLSSTIFEELAADGATNAMDDGSYSSNENRCISADSPITPDKSFSSPCLEYDHYSEVKASTRGHIPELDPVTLFPVSPSMTIDSQLTESPGLYQFTPKEMNFSTIEDSNIDLTEITSEPEIREGEGIENDFTSLFPKAVSADSLNSLLFHPIVYATEENEDPRIVGRPFKEGLLDSIAENDIQKKIGLRFGLGSGLFSDIQLQDHSNRDVTETDDAFPL